jgi:hypothetical protein
MLKALVLAALVACGGSAAQRPPPISNDKPPPPASAPYSLAIVMNTWELWLGNDKIANAKLPADDPSRTPGILTSLAAAFTKLDLARTAPPGSRAMVITFADKATVRSPLAPITGFTGATLGTQDDYFGTAGRELVAGVTLALDQLAKAPTPRKVLLVLCDGTDTDLDAAMTQLPKLKAQAARDGIEVHALVYRIANPLLTPEINLVPRLTDHMKVVTSFENVEADLRHIFETLGK